MKFRILFLGAIFLTLCTTVIVSAVSFNQDDAKRLSGYYEIIDGLYVSHAPGVYEEDIKLEFVVTDKDSKLFYSLDSSEPTRLYGSPIKIKSKSLLDLKEYPLTTSVDAVLSQFTDRCFSYNYIDNIQNPGHYNLSDKINVVTIKYVDSEGNEYTRSLSYLHSKYLIPVVSLSMEYNEWFGEEGFYNKIRDNISKYVNLEYFDMEYDEYFYANSKIKLGGNWSLGYPQRTLNLNFNKDKDGNKNNIPDTHIFKDRKQLGNTNEELVDLSRFRLHNSGNSFEDFTGFNDAVIQQMMAYTNASTTSYRPCIAYLNGEYWGIYYIREHYSDTYFADNYNVDKDSVALYELKGNILFDDGDDSDFESFFDSLNKFLKRDFSDNQVYEEFINTYIDVDSLIDVFIAQSYAGNWDFVGNYNNLKMWRTTTIDPNNPYADGKLRFCLHDVDFAFNDYANYLEKNTANSYSKFEMFRKLLENEQFKTRFYQRTEELMATNLSAINAAETLNRMVNEVKPYKSDAMVRWGDYRGMKAWTERVKVAFDYFNRQEENYLGSVKRALNQY